MTPYSMVVVILLIIFGFVFGSVMFGRYMSYKKSLLKERQGVNAKSISIELEEQKKIIADLANRIQVLESIVTQEDYELNQKFKHL